MPSYQGKLTKEELLLSRFVKSSPFRPDPDPQVIDRSAIVTCDECGRQFLNSDRLDQHLADGHTPADDPSVDLELALSRTDGMPLSPFQVIAKDILARIRSRDLKPGDHVILNELVRRYGHTLETVNKAVRLLVTHGIIRQAGYGRYTTWTVAGHDAVDDDDQS